jgi:hypothetical protein
MTLGPSIILLVVFERLGGFLSKFLIVFGRVPMFFYVVHLYSIHFMAVLLGLYQGFSLSQMFNLFKNLPDDYGIGLLGTYIAWIILIISHYYLCKNYIKFKKGKKHPFFSYI